MQGEQNIQNNFTGGEKKIFTAIFLVIILIGLLLGSYLIFPGLFNPLKKIIRPEVPRQGELPITTEQKQQMESIKQAKALLASSEIIFSKVSSLSKISEKDIPVEIKESVLSVGVDDTYNKIKYADGNTGFFLTYLIKDTNIKDAIGLFEKNMKSWTKIDSSYASEFGFVDYKSITGESYTRILLFQSGKDIKLNIKSETK